ncbi:hypothetical protein SASPL_156839 [Salvia splendens]|uniref:Disease resistance N-terminal domain-containing protein n=1 Tax=Salvia splendens TaxID=180675 RepID=A0A8X8VW54_SALSN|nr:hypothetical protein SASPL_156839 [Salvia splendens]
MEGVSSAAIDVLVQNLINLFKDEYSLLRGLDEDAQQLQRTLGTIQAYLNDAEKKSITQDAVKIWLRELEAVAFDADNVLDELSYHLLHKKVKKMMTPKAKDKIQEDRIFSMVALVGMGDVPMWEDFINSMSGVTSTTGNGILITTRSEKVASTVNPFHIHHLNGLSDEYCWSIIKAKTFDENGEVPSGFEMIGRKIAKRCQGLPLAANVVGECFVVNPKKSGAPSMKLGFQMPKKNSLLQVVDKDEYGNVSEFVMHDLVHDLASSVVSNNADGSIVVGYKFVEEESSPIPKNVAKHLRTLFLKGGIPGTIFSNFERLHNLTLSGGYNELPNSIREMSRLDVKESAKNDEVHV